MMNGKPVKIWRGDNIALAYNLKNILENNGIEAYIENETQPSLSYLIPVTTAMADLVVDGEDAETAINLIKNSMMDDFEGICFNDDEVFLEDDKLPGNNYSREFIYKSLLFTGLLFLAGLFLFHSFFPGEKELARRTIDYYNSGNYIEALESVSDAIKKNGSSSYYYYLRSNCYAALSDYKAALVDIDKSISLSPHKASLYMHRSTVLFALKSYEQAYSSISRAIELDTTDPDFYFERFRTAVKLGLNNEAMSDINRAIQMEENSIFYLNRGYFYYKKNLMHNAVKDYTKAISLDSSDVAAYSGRGFAYIALRNYDAASNDLNKTLELKPSDPDVLYDLASFYSLIKEKKLAIEYLTQAVDNGFDDIDHMNNDSYLDYIRNAQEYKELVSRVGSNKASSENK